MLNDQTGSRFEEKLDLILTHIMVCVIVNYEFRMVFVFALF